MDRHRTTRPRNAFTLLEMIASAVIVSIITGVAVVGYTASVSRAVTDAGEAELEQVASASTDFFLAASERSEAENTGMLWEEAIGTAVSSVAAQNDSDVEFAGFVVVNDTPDEPAHSRSYGEVSWRYAADGEVGFAMLNKQQNCVMSKVVDRAVVTWTVEGLADLSVCAGRFSLEGELPANEYEPKDPNNITVLAPSFCAALGGKNGTIALRWDKVAGAEKYEVHRDGSFLRYVPATSAAEQTWTDVGLPGNTEFTYNIATLNADSVRSPLSADCESRPAPDTPTGLIAIRNAGNVDTSWDANDPDDDVSYRLNRSVLIEPAADLRVPGARLTEENSASRSGTDALEIVADIVMDNYSTAGVSTIASNKSVTGGWELQLTSGRLQLQWVSDGAAQSTATSTSTVPFLNGTPGWVRAALNPNVSGNHEVTFETSLNQLDWLPLGTPVTRTGTTSIGTSTTDYTVGQPAAGSSVDGVAFLRVSDGATGNVITQFSVLDVDPDPQSLNATSDYGNSWTSSPEMTLSGVTTTQVYSGPNTTFTDTNVSSLATGAQLSYRVRAAIPVPALMSDFSDPAKVTTGLSAPVLAAPSPGDRQVALDWTSVTGAASYAVEVAASNAGSPGTWATFGTFAEDGTNPADQSAVVTQLVNDETYFFRVRAQDSQGPGAWSNEVSATPFRGVGNVVNLVAVGGPPNGVPSETLRVSWDPPPGTSSLNPVTEYEVRVWNRAGGTRPTQPSQTVSAPRTLTFSNSLTNGDDYNVEVIAVYRSAKSVTPTTTVGTPFDVPVPPEVYVSDAIYDTGSARPGADVAWFPPTNSGGETVVNYDVQCARSNSSSVVAQGSTADASRNLDVFQFTPGQIYRCRAQANTTAASSGFSDWGPNFTAFGPPLAPPMTVTELSSRLGVAWTAPSGQGRPVTQYRYGCARATSSPYTSGSATTTGRSAALSLTAERLYRCGVQAYNGLWGPWSNATGTPYRTPYTINTPVVETREVLAGNRTVIVDWSAQVAAVSNGGRAVTNYGYSCLNRSSGRVVKYGTVGVGTTRITFQGDAYGTFFDCKWRARNIAGWSVWSPEAGGKTADDYTVNSSTTVPPPPPTTQPPPTPGTAPAGGTGSGTNCWDYSPSRCPSDTTGPTREPVYVTKYRYNARYVMTLTWITVFDPTANPVANASGSGFSSWAAAYQNCLARKPYKWKGNTKPVTTSCNISSYPVLVGFR